ncbi:MAG: SRPBCC domain-containing protein [Acidobacteriia bacterium]|nr:SRPBCC domain-containing protein [Terriglobia bacterium]
MEAVGLPSPGQIYQLGFGPSYSWQARVSAAEPDVTFELEITVADSDWQGSRIGFSLEEQNGRTQVQFRHTGWPEQNAHFRTSGFCWAMYLRLLKRYCESGEVIPYNMRLKA